jgi:hypothetical protein
MPETTSTGAEARLFPEQASRRCDKTIRATTKPPSVPTARQRASTRGPACTRRTETFEFWLAEARLHLRTFDAEPAREALPGIPERASTCIFDGGGGRI